MSLIRSSCSATQTKAPTSPTRRVPMVRAKPKSATGGESAGPNTACRANDRCLAESHSDWEAIRYRRPATRRSNMFILSSRHVRALLSSERCVEKAREGRRRRRYAIRSAKVGLADLHRYFPKLLWLFGRKGNRFGSVEYEFRD